MSVPAQACAWCERPLGDGAKRLAGRTRCRACGAATTDPWPSEADLDEAYGNWYRPAAGRFAQFGDALLQRTRAHLARHLDRVAPPGPVLDVGAGEGVLLDALGARGRAAEGLERQPSRPDLRTDPVDSLDGDYAAVVFWHSLEHLRKPGRTLGNATALLRRGGVLVVAMPNSDSLQARAFGDRWLALDLPRHLVHVPAYALLVRLRDLGFRVERVSYWRGGQVLFGWLHGLVGILPGHPDLHDAIRRPGARRRAVSAPTLLATLLAAAMLLPAAALGALAEVAARRGGSVYVEARRE